MATPSPVKPSDICDTIPESTGSICTKLTALWSLANKMCQFFEWFMDTDGFLSDGGKDFLAEASVPVGSIVFWPLDIAPEGWLTANGATVSRTTYANLFAVYGTKYGVGDGSTTFGLPNMERRFPFGRSGTNVAGTTGGAESVTLEIANLPAHKPELAADIEYVLVVDTGNGTNSEAAGANVRRLPASDAFADVGDDEPFDILPPYLSGSWIIKV